MSDVQLLRQMPWPLFGFFALWAGICFLLAQVSGWAGLARRLRASGPPSGERFRFASGSMGSRYFPVNYSSCLSIDVGDDGVHLSMFLLFRFACPPLFIPWAQLDSVTSRKFMFMSSTVLQLREHWPAIVIRGKAGQAIGQAYARWRSVGVA
ncbi:MAG: hypothetical protein V4484_08905 [Pseudomonadota bacterium]